MLLQKQRELQTLHAQQSQKLLHKQRKDRKWFHEQNLNEKKLAELETLHHRELTDLQIRQQREQLEMVDLVLDCMPDEAELEREKHRRGLFESDESMPQAPLGQSKAEVIAEAQRQIEELKREKEKQMAKLQAPKVRAPSPVEDSKADLLAEAQRQIQELKMEKEKNLAKLQAPSPVEDSKADLLAEAQRQLQELKMEKEKNVAKLQAPKVQAPSPVEDSKADLLAEAQRQIQELKMENEKQLAKLQAPKARTPSPVEETDPQTEQEKKLAQMFASAATSHQRQAPALESPTTAFTPVRTSSPIPEKEAMAPAAPPSLPDRISKDRQKADEIKAVMRDRSLSREERQGKLAEIKERYAAGGPPTVAARAKRRASNASAETPSSASQTSQEAVLRLDKEISEQRRLELQTVMKDRSLGKSKFRRKFYRGILFLSKVFPIAQTLTCGLMAKVSIQPSNEPSSVRVKAQWSDNIAVDRPMISVRIHPWVVDK